MSENSFRVRISKRARHARIVVRPDMQVEVVLPEGVNRDRAALLFQQKRAWVERSLQRFSMNRKPAHFEDSFPSTVEFPAFDSLFDLSYQSSGFPGSKIIEAGSTLTITGRVDDSLLVKSLLQHWLKVQARAQLLPMLNRLAEQYGFAYAKFAVRLQKSRWGSCSAAGNISLNAKLLFLPQHLIEYVILHELAHLKHLNHSPAFWRVVAGCDRDCLLHRREMRSASRYIPVWAE